jgi:putative intracellular protease/amidase
MTPSDWKHYTCPDFRKRLVSSLKPSDVKTDDYQCICYVGGHGVVWDFPDNKELQHIAQDIYKKGGVIVGICHGVVGLFNIKDDKGELLIKGKKITSFSNMEEKIVGADKNVPYSVEDELNKRGAHYLKA